MQSLLVQLHLGSQDERLAIRFFFRCLHVLCCYDCRVSFFAALGLGVLSDYWSPCSDEYPDDQFCGVRLPNQCQNHFNLKTLRRNFSKLTFPLSLRKGQLGIFTP